MNTYIAILRGINVGGHRKIKMAELKKLFINLDYQNIRTYIQSGNIVFQAATSIKQELESLIKESISKNYGFEAPVIVIDLNAFGKIVEQNTFINDANKNPDYFHITFLANKPTKEAIVELKSLSLPNEVFTITEQAVYLYCPNGYSKTKLTNGFIEKKLQVTATTRNWKTTLQLLNMATQPPNI